MPVRTLGIIYIQYSLARSLRLRKDAPANNGDMAMTDDRLVAAHLAAALIAKAPIEKAKGDAADNAVKIYLDVLKSLQSQKKQGGPEGKTVIGTYGR